MSETVTYELLERMPQTTPDQIIERIAFLNHEPPVDEEILYTKSLDGGLRVEGPEDEVIIDDQSAVARILEDSFMSRFVDEIIEDPGSNVCTPPRDEALNKFIIVSSDYRLQSGLIIRFTKRLYPATPGSRQRKVADVSVTARQEPEPLAA